MAIPIHRPFSLLPSRSDKVRDFYFFSQMKQSISASVQLSQDFTAIESSITHWSGAGFRQGRYNGRDFVHRFVEFLVGIGRLPDKSEQILNRLNYGICLLFQKYLR